MHRAGRHQTALDKHVVSSDITHRNVGSGAYLKVSGKAEATTSAPKKRVVPETSAEERDTIRAWAKKEGYDIAEFGRITKKVMKAFDEAHGIDRSK